MNDIIPMSEQCEPKMLCREPDSIRRGLEASKKHLEERLAKVNAGLQVLDQDPKMAEQLETLTKALRA